MTDAKKLYGDVLYTRSEAITLGVLWNSCTDDTKIEKFQKYCAKWVEYQELDLKLARMQINED